MADGTTGKVVILGEDSNLTKALQRRREVEVFSARRLLQNRSRMPDVGPYSLVINAFQPATELGRIADPEAYIASCLGATARSLSQAVDGGCSRVLFTSSAVVYGANPHCREDDPPSVTGLHSALKLAGEELVRAVCRSTKIEFTVVRLFNLYGGDDHFSVVSRVLKAARQGHPFLLANEGSSVRDFIHVDDAAQSYLAVLGADAAPEVINVASGRGTRISDLVELARQVKPGFRVSSAERDEVPVSIADVGRLAAMVDVASFIDVQGYLKSGLNQ